MLNPDRYMIHGNLAAMLLLYGHFVQHYKNTSGTSMNRIRW